MAVRPDYVAVGPSRRWYAVAAALWVGGWFLLFLVGYGSVARLDEAPADLARSDLTDELVIQVDEPGTWTVWLEQVAGGDRPGRARAVLADVEQRPVEHLLVASPEGEFVVVEGTDSPGYVTTINGNDGAGHAVAEFPVGRGEHRLAFTGGGQAPLAGLAVGASPEPPLPLSVGFAGPGVAIVGLVMAWIVRRRRLGCARAAGGG